MAIFLCAVLPNFVTRISGEFDNTIGDSIFTVFFSVMFVFYTYVLVKSYVKIEELKEKLQ